MYIWYTKYLNKQGEIILTISGKHQVGLEAMNKLSCKVGSLQQQLFIVYNFYNSNIPTTAELSFFSVYTGYAKFDK